MVTLAGADFFASVTSLAFVGVGWTVVIDSLSTISAEFFLDAPLVLELLLESTFASVFGAFSVESFFDAFSVESFFDAFSVVSFFDVFPDAFDVTALATVVDAAVIVVGLSPEGKE